MTKKKKVKELLHDAEGGPAEGEEELDEDGKVRVREYYTIEHAVGASGMHHGVHPEPGTKKKKQRLTKNSSNALDDKE